MFSVVLGKMGCGGVMGDCMVGEKLRGVSTRVLTVMADMAQTP
jgi:hypothetical protein